MFVSLSNYDTLKMLAHGSYFYSIDLNMDFPFKS